MSHLVEVEGLSVDYGWRQPVHAVRDVTLAIEDSEFVGLVGESGCGKSTLAMAIARLERSPGHLIGGRIRIGGEDWTALEPEAIRTRRWRQVAIVLQSGMNALNPIMTIGAQFEDVMREHSEMTRADIRRRAEETMEMVQIDPRVLARYPHELSGGMKQRAAIALALALRPRLVIMDEPTTALDVVVQRQIIENLKALRREQAFAMLFVSHDLGLILELCDRVVVMYAGQVVETDTSVHMLTGAHHPYTRALLEALPDPENPTAGYTGIPGTPPELRNIPSACMFAPRCSLRRDVCLTSPPPLERFGDLELRCVVTREEVRDVVGTGA
jgi:oligopeptide/dipeptide ABC transporter ATP-binding protein